MSRMIKDFVEIGDYTSLDSLIEKLVEIRDSLAPEAAPEVRLRGDDVFGRHLSIAYFRPQTAEEIECDARYAEAHRESQARLAASTTEQGRDHGGLRAVA